MLLFYVQFFGDSFVWINRFEKVERRVRARISVYLFRKVFDLMRFNATEMTMWRE